jgi:hypothetical protein
MGLTIVAAIAAGRFARAKTIYQSAE